MSKQSENRYQKSAERNGRLFSVGLAIISSALLLASLKLPLWQMRLEAPQYRDQEALNVAVHPNAFRGDLREITVLDQYIGVHIPSTLPQFKWLPAVLIGGAAAGLAFSFLPVLIRRWGLMAVSFLLAATMAIAAIQATTQIRDIGHKRDQKTVLTGVKDFTPPFLGTSRIAQFTVSSRFGTGAWLVGGAIVIQVGAAWLSRRTVRVAAPISVSQTLSEFGRSAACTTECAFQI
jgi:hypothetical protein